jgi:WD40 repeat protein
LVSATRQQAQVIVWDTQAARPLFPQLALADSTDAVTGLSFSADGSTFAVGEGGKQVELFDRVTAQPLGAPLTDPLGGGVGPVAFAPDGASLLTGPRLRLWTPLALSRDISAVASRLCTFAQRNLTRLEWHLLLPDQPYQKTCAQWPVKAR